MINNSGSTTLVWCVVLAIGLNFAMSSSQDIHCTTDATIQTQCECRRVFIVSWSDDDEEPAPRPKSMTLSLLDHDPLNRKCGVTSSAVWTQKAVHFHSGFVEGYDIEISVSCEFKPKLFECSLRNLAVSSDMVTFVFNDTIFFSCCPIPTGEEVTYVINPRPRYINNSNPSWIEQTVEILPKVKDYAMNTMEDIELRNVETTATTTVTDPGILHNGWIFFAVSVFGAVLTTTVLTLYCVCKNMSKRNKATKRIMVIGNSYDSNSIKVCNDLIETLKRCSQEHANIETNIRNLEQVGENGILEWMSQRMKTMDVIVFIVLSPNDWALLNANTQQRTKCSHVAMAMKAAQTVTLHQSSRCSTKFMALFSCKPPGATFCHCYDIKSERQNLLKDALGYWYKPNRSANQKRKVRRQNKSDVTDAVDTDGMLQNNLSRDDHKSIAENDLTILTTFGAENNLGLPSSVVNIGMTIHENNPPSIENNADV